MDPVQSSQFRSWCILYIILNTLNVYISPVISMTLHESSIPPLHTSNLKLKNLPPKQPQCVIIYPKHVVLAWGWRWHPWLSKANSYHLWGQHFCMLENNRSDKNHHKHLKALRAVFAMWPLQKAFLLRPILFYSILTKYYHCSLSVKRRTPGTIFSSPPHFRAAGFNKIKAWWLTSVLLSSGAAEPESDLRPAPIYTSG